jgi:hypothetical protein
MIERVAETLRTPERIEASFDARVMAAVRALPAPRRRLSFWQWLVQPKPMPVSPIGGLAFGGAMAALLMVAVMRGEPDGAAVSVASVGDTSGPTIRLVNSAPRLTTAVVGRTVQFAIAAPAAKRVAVVGDFNDWDPDSTMLQRTANGEWTVTVPLPAGRYTYNFLIDGEQWMSDPNMPAEPGDEFLGVSSSIVTVGEPIR